MSDHDPGRPPQDRSHQDQPHQGRYESELAKDSGPSSLVEPAGRFLLNLAVVAIFYFLFTLGDFNLTVVLLITTGVTVTNYIYGPLQRAIPWLFWALLAFGGVIVAGGLYQMMWKPDQPDPPPGESREIVP